MSTAPVLALPDGVVAALTPAEREVVSLLLAGRPNREIAILRGAAESTVKHQLASAYRKLGVSSRARLMAQLLHPPPAPVQEENSHLTRP